MADEKARKMAAATGREIDATIAFVVARYSACAFIRLTHPLIHNHTPSDTQLQTPPDTPYDIPSQASSYKL